MSTQRPIPADNDEAPAEAPAERSAKQKGPFGGLSPSEAARRSHAPSSARHNPSDTSDAAIIGKLRSKAVRGDVAAARELREWADQDADATGAGDEWLALLTAEERGLVRGLLRHVRARKLGQVEGQWPVVAELGDDKVQAMSVTTITK